MLLNRGFVFFGSFAYLSFWQLVDWQFFLDLKLYTRAEFHISWKSYLLGQQKSLKTEMTFCNGNQTR